MARTGGVNDVRTFNHSRCRGGDYLPAADVMSTVRLLASGSFASLSLPARKARLALVVGASGALIGATVAPDAVLTAVMLSCILAWAAAIDFDRLILPDVLTLGLIVAGLCLALTEGIEQAQPYILGSIVGYAVLAGIAWLYRLVRKRQGLGLGDAKLFAAAGAWLGWQALPFVILIASTACLALVWTTAVVRQQPVTRAHVAFGPYLALAMWVIWVAQMSGRL